MKTYRLDPEKLNKQTKRSCLSVLAFALYCLLGLFIPSEIYIKFVIPHIISMVAFLILILIKNSKFKRNIKLWNEYSLAIEEKEASLIYPDLPATQISKTDVTGIKDSDHSFFVLTGINGPSFEVLDYFSESDYQEIRQIFEKWIVENNAKKTRSVEEEDSEELVSKMSSVSNESLDEHNEKGVPLNFFFGFGSDGDLELLPTDEDGNLSFTFVFDEEGELLPEINCPKCNGDDYDVLDGETDLYKCQRCGFEFIPEIYAKLDTADEYTDRAGYNFHNGRYQHVIKDAEAAIKLDPTYRRGYFWKGKGHLERKEYEESEAAYTKAIEISPDYDFAYHDRGYCRLLSGNYDGAIDDLTTSIGFDPETAETHRLRATAYFKKEEYTLAIKDYSTVIQMGEGNVDDYRDRGYCYACISNDMQALRDYSKAILEDRHDADSYFRRAEAHERLGNLQEAIIDFQTSTRYYDDADLIYESAKRIKSIQENHGLELVTSIDNNLDEDSIDASYMHLIAANKKMEAGDLDEAFDEVNKAIMLYSNESLAYFLRGLLFQTTGLPKEALKDYDRTITLGGFIEAYGSRGEIHFQNNEFEKAIADLDVIINDSPDKTELIARHYAIRGVAFLKLGENEKAISDLTKAIELDPQDADFFRDRAAAFQTMDNFDAAIADLETVIEISDNEEQKTEAQKMIEELSSD